MSTTSSSGSIRGDVSLKDLPWTLDGGGNNGGGGSCDSGDQVGHTHKSTSKASLLSYGDDETMDEFDAACSILNELQSKGLISKEEKHRRKRLVMQYMEFAAVDYAAESDSSSHYWGPLMEALRCALRASTSCLRCCGCMHQIRPI